MALNKRQQLFAQEYIVDMNATQAAIRAGYSEKTAGQIGEKLLRKVEIAESVRKAIAMRTHRVETDADDLLRQLQEMRQADTLEILDELGNYKPLEEWPLIWRQMINGIDIQEIFEKDEDGYKKKIGQVVKVKFIDRVKILELFGKHTDVNAWVERKELNITDNRTDRLKRGRQRVIEAQQNEDGTYVQRTG